MKTGFIGTGLMGNPMAEKLLSVGNELLVYNRTIEKTSNLKIKGAQICSTPAEVILKADIIFLMLADGKAIEDVLKSILSFGGKTIIQMSTVSPEENKLFAKKVITSGGDFLEAPVLGSIQQVKESKLFVMVGSTKALYEKHSATLQIFGESIYIGEVGKASALKLAFNQLIASLTASFSISLGIVQKEKIDVELFMGILKRSALMAPTFEKKLDNMLTRNFDATNFPTKHLLKDVNLVIDEAKKLEINTSSLEGVQKILEHAIKMGLSEKDYSSLYNAVVS
ncbi:MAG: NAD(P)-dependent oxidoreductase [Ignavibacteriales bacterium]|nr:NAD(P)-dependent oxidoreductase [Ignavibacteriales bacterium]